VPMNVVEGVAGTAGVGTTFEIVGIVVVPIGPSDTLGVGIPAAELTPRLAISVESSGIPVRGIPPGVVGTVDVGVVGDVAMLPELNPHKPDTPTSVEAVDIPKMGGIPEAVDVVDGADIPVVAVAPDIAAGPAVAAVAAIADPIVIPPPS
jgi:hypothetical protein